MQVPQEKLIKRREAAALYGCSEPTIRRFERDGLLVPVKIDAARVRWHSPKAVLALKAKRLAPAPTPTAPIDGNTAGDAFAAYDAGATPADVVKSLRVAPEVARQLYNDWADLAGGFVIGGHVRAKLLERLGYYDDANALATGEDLLRLLDHMDFPLCASGCEHTPKFCMVCFHKRPRQALEVLARELAAIEEREKKAAERDARKRAVEQARRARVVERSGPAASNVRESSSVATEDAGGIMPVASPVGPNHETRSANDTATATSTPASAE